MSWKYWRGGRWNTATVKQRANGQWVAIDESGDNGGSTRQIPPRFYTDGPPTRNGKTITYPDDGHSSLQAAYEALTEDDTLVISAGTYTERLRLAQDPTDHVTIIGEGDVTIVQPDDADRYTVGMNAKGGSHPNDTSLAAAHTGNETTLQVTDASPFVGNEGSVIHIKEYQNPYGYTGPPDGDPTVEYATIASVDDGSDTIELQNPLHFQYPNEALTEVGVVDWTIEDIRLSNLTIHGDPSFYSSSSENLMPLHLYDLRELWIDSVTVEHAANSGMLTRIGYSYRPRLDDITFNNGNRYGLDIVRGTTDACVTNVSATNIARYATRWGRPGPGPVGGFAQNVNGYGYNNFTASAHLGGYHIDHEEVHADACGVIRLRSRDINLDGFSEVNGKTQSFILGQIPDQCTVRNGTITDKQGGYVFYSDIGHDNWDYSWARDITFENIKIQEYDERGPEDIGFFTSGGGTFKGDFVFRDILYGDEYLTESHVRSWDNFDLQDINNLIVEVTDSNGG